MKTKNAFPKSGRALYGNREPAWDRLLGVVRDSFDQDQRTYEAMFDRGETVPAWTMDDQVPLPPMVRGREYV